MESKNAYPGSIQGLIPVTVLLLYWVHVGMLSHSGRVQLFVTAWTIARRFLCTRDFQDKITGMGCHALLHVLGTHIP